MEKLKQAIVTSPYLIWIGWLLSLKLDNNFVTFFLMIFPLYGVYLAYYLMKFILSEVLLAVLEHEYNIHILNERSKTIANKMDPSLDLPKVRPSEVFILKTEPADP